MKMLRHAACVLLATASFLTLPAHATSYSTDQSDLYYIPAESGWGMQLVQRGSVIFATLFVYDQSGTPIWYTATLQPTGTPLVWSGTLYLTNGPWFGTVPFNPALVGISPVGTMTWAAPTEAGGSLTYSVNGVAVSKSVIRQALALDDYNGSYLGALNGTATDCTNPAGDVTIAAPVNITVTQTGQTISITAATSDSGSVTFNGTLTQAGQFGMVTGAYAFTSGEVGDFTMFEVNGQFNYWTARLSLNSTNDGCQSTGILGGMRE